MAVRDFRTLCKTVLDNYLVEKNNTLKDNWLAEMIRKDLPQTLYEALNLDKKEFKVKASPGHTLWANVPWVAIFNRSETETAQGGVYVVYLFSEDMQRLYLTLNQGVTNQIKTKGRPKALEWLRLNADEIASQYSSSEFVKGDGIKLGGSDLARAYEKACIYYKEYKKENLPSNYEMIKYLTTMIELYGRYTAEKNADIADMPYIDYPEGVAEGKKVYRNHVYRERNPVIINIVKRRRRQEVGELLCDVCGFSFKEKYGSRGEDFIEGHHTLDVSKMEEGHVTKPEDIALVCSNCHRMIHRNPPLTIEELRSIIKS